jgi:predicted MPP superfamily phosphohydrolase
MWNRARSRSASSTFLRRWQFLLHAVLLAAALSRAAVSAQALILVVLVPVCFLPFSYARLRLHRFIERWLAGSRLAAAVIPIAIGGALLDALMVAQLLTARLAAPLPFLQSTALGWAGAVWFSAHAILVVGLAALGLARAAGRGGRAVASRLAWTAANAAREPDQDEPMSLERRRFVQQLGLVGAGAPFIVSLTGVELSYDFRVEEYAIPLPRWPRALDGLRVAHLSDIHVGGAMNRARLLHVAALTAAARPDLVLHTGDFLTHRGGDFDAPLYEALARIAAPHGQWACLGNHDFEDSARLTRRLRDAGVITLRDAMATTSIQGVDVEIAGLDFRFERAARGAHYAEAIGRWGSRPAAPRLLLNHDPTAFAALPGGSADLVLSGHTHGGHVGIQLAPGHAATVIGLLGIPDQGIFDGPDMRLFVTRCVGFYGYPMRLGIPPEIAILTLRSA